MNIILHDPLHQPGIAAIPDRLWDVAVVGAGPAGAMAACHLAGHGYAVLLLEKQRFPRDKVCGDALIPDAIHCLRRAGIYERIHAVAHSVSTLRVYSPSRHMIDLPAELLTIRRIALDEMLAAEAASRGATLAIGRVREVKADTDEAVELSVDGANNPVHARVAVLATGADVALLQKLDMVEQPRASATALRCYIRSPLALDPIVISFDRSIIPGYAWIFPMGGGEYNVGCGIFYRGEASDSTCLRLPVPLARQTGAARRQVNLRTIFDTFMRVFPLAQELMAEGEIISPVKGARLRCGLMGAEPVKCNRILAIGETIGATFPFTGEGIGKAMETGELAASAIHQAFADRDLSRLAHFSTQLEQSLRPRYAGYKIAEEWLSSAWISDFLVRRAQKSAYLRDAAAGILSETADPRAIFSVRGLMRSLWK